MKCIVCRHGETRPGTTTIAFSRDGSTIVINDVPAQVCENCSEAYVDEDTTRKVLTIAKELRESGATVAVRSFSPAAA
jgi:YgiT-type zinc finger domain-containing protein